MAENFIDFREIKKLISIASVLDHYGVKLRKVNENSLRGRCPLPTHSSETSKEGFGVNTAKNIWACQSSSCARTRAGKKGGNVLDFVSAMENCAIKEAAEKLQQWFDSTNAVDSQKSNPPDSRVDSAGSIRVEKKPVAERKEGSGSEEKKDGDAENIPLKFTLKDVDPKHPYLRSRGIKEETARHFGVGYFPGKGSMQNRIVIPISNDGGELVAYAGRSIDATEPKYKMPAGFHKSVELFNLHRIENRERVILVEGFFDAMKVHQAGFTQVVALMGCSLSETQGKLLQRFRSVILFLDGDGAGREAAKLIGARLMHSHFVKVVSLSEGKQPDRLSSDEIRKLLEQ